MRVKTDSCSSHHITWPAFESGPAVFSSPHSGRDYPKEFINDAILDPVRLRASEDAFVERLFDSAPKFGAPLLAARFPRAYVDANRNENELDPAVISGLPTPAPRRTRVSAGLGVIPRVVAEGRPIYRGKLSLEEAHRRIDACWRPYHSALAELIDAARDRWGYAVLFDCHSMPAILERASGGCDVVLGDNYGAACAPTLTAAAMDIFTAAGFRVGRNTPFAGGYITRAYGRPHTGAHALQIELSRGLYLHEGDVTPKPEFDDVRARLAWVTQELIAASAAHGGALAAQ